MTWYSSANTDPKRKWALLVIFFLLQSLFSVRLEKWIHPTPFETSASGAMDQRIVSSLRAVALLTGYKVLIGHVFWIEVIQYYGDGENGKDRFSKLYDYCRLASDLNPEFIPVYTYGSAALAYQLKRMDEAAKLLQKGILANPRNDKLKLMLAAIAYHYNENYEREIPFLEAQIAQGSAPTMLVNILANTYMKAGRNADAIRLWRHIIATGDSPGLKAEAAQKLQELYKKIRSKESAGRS